METAADILFFWVARMIMLGIYRTKKIPFKHVYLHGLVRDKDKQKMSKSKGNVIDPLGVAEEYGADAVRAALVAGNTPGRDTAISEDKIRGYRNFTTKLWNIYRFIAMNLTQINADQNADKRGKISVNLRINQRPSASIAQDKKHLQELQKIKRKVTKHLESFEFHLALETIYHYTWHEFADKIIEESKPFFSDNPRINPRESASKLKLLATILEECLVMLHPFMPFITEEIYQELQKVQGTTKKELLMVRKW